jgi:hypothetical protein
MPKQMCLMPFPLTRAELVGYKDKLLNYRLAMLEIQDASVIKLSGKTHHPIAVSSQSDTVSGP